ncbi:MAG: methylenetetrahydrofolate reductase [NAD(P)H] [Desulfuromonadaceae bacterium]|nr:methylenetetrahydrofolate reductase [NAD(P)H] [Desulfuromonadaceae bacterium]MDD2849342.1 methylenetetrahydrofolate reductase [NAD(P)H] [Desulfuromonadaceae bacterium]MDD4129401.1 methylenetetrahydrofolate reductase [NAD(P)H] [Desulfuromonadaceae bacterium]
MKIIDSINQNKQFMSLEFFPPKKREDWPAFFETVEKLARLNPLFASVTYGAGGSAHAESLEIVTRLQQEYGLETMAHLTCIGSEPGEIRQFLSDLAAAGVDNVLALRGDLPTDGTTVASTSSPLQYASDLVSLIRDSFPNMGVGVAGYPEVHPEAVSPQADLSFLKLKLDNGADFAITQLFFDNSLYHAFVKRAREAGVSKPIIPGILPVVSLKVVKRIVSLCGASIPPEFLADLEQADNEGGAAAVQKIGIAHARKQIRELLDSGVPGVHLYTLNRAEVVMELLEGVER